MPAQSSTLAARFVEVISSNVHTGDAHDVDPGPLGCVKCATGLAAALKVASALWGDSYGIGVVYVYFQSDATSEALFGQFRQAIEIPA